VPEQIVEITRPGIALSKSRGFLEVKSSGEVIGKVPIDDILTVLISVPGCSISTVLIDHLCQRNIPLVICGENYLPTSLVLPVEGQGRQFRVMRAQIDMTEPRRKRAWQHIVRSKILNQSDVLVRAGKSNLQFPKIAELVKSGDSGNHEAQAARLYWGRLFGGEFRRSRHSAGINSALNYAYAILRSCVARGCIAAGLHPSFSLHHINPQNPLNLVDDLMEPFRPMADYLVWLKQEQLTGELSPEAKAGISGIVNIAVPMANQELSPLSLAAVKYCRSFAAYCMKEQDHLLLPSLPAPLDMSAV